MAGKPVVWVAAAARPPRPYSDGGAGLRDEPEQRLGDIQQGQDGDDRADLVADDRARADPERRAQGGRHPAASDDGGGLGAADAGRDVPGGQQRHADDSSHPRGGQAEGQSRGGHDDELGHQQRVRRGVIRTAGVMVLCRNSPVTDSAPASSATVWASPAIARVVRAGLMPAVKLVAAAVAPVPLAMRATAPAASSQ